MEKVRRNLHGLHIRFSSIRSKMGMVLDLAKMFTEKKFIHGLTHSD